MMCSSAALSAAAAPALLPATYARSGITARGAGCRRPAPDPAGSNVVEPLLLHLEHRGSGQGEKAAVREEQGRRDGAEWCGSRGGRS